MNLKDLTDKLASLDNLEKLSSQIDKKIPGEQPTLDPKADISAMTQALNVLRTSTMSPSNVQQPQAAPQNTEPPQNTAPPEKKELQQKNKPGEPVGEELVDEQPVDRETAIRQARERNLAIVQKNLAQAYAANDTANIERWTNEYNKRSAQLQAAPQSSAGTDSSTSQADAADPKKTDAPQKTVLRRGTPELQSKPDASQSTPDAQTAPAKPKADLGAGGWYKGTEGDYTIQKGDTLSSIAKKTGVPLSQLMRLNKIENPNKILAGAKINTGKETKPETAIGTDSNTTTASDPAVDKVDTSTATDGGFKFTPDQEKWLGGADRQDPNIINRMPSNLGPKPPLSYFTDPESQARAREINQGNKNINSLSNLFRSKSNVKPGTDTFGADTSSPAAEVDKPAPPAPASSANTASNTDTLRHQGKNAEISNLMKAGTQKENILSLDKIVDELLNRN